jgi:hypothetical protein
VKVTVACDVVSSGMNTNVLEQFAMNQTERHRIVATAVRTSNLTDDLKFDAVYRQESSVAFGKFSCVGLL